jgi:hypothetical protein
VVLPTPLACSTDCLNSVSPQSRESSWETLGIRDRWESGKTNTNTNTFTWSGPSGVLGCTGQRRVAPLYGGGWGCSQVPETGDGCLAVPLNAAESGVTENLRGGKRLRLRFWKGCHVQHTYPLSGAAKYPAGARPSKASRSALTSSERNQLRKVTHRNVMMILKFREAKLHLL